MIIEQTIRIEGIRSDESDNLVMYTLKQEDTVPHTHNFFELAYVLQGASDYTLNEYHGTLQTGDYFFIDYGSNHSFINCQDMVIVNCLFLPEFIDETLQGCKSLEELLHACMIRYYRLTVGLGWADRIFHDKDGKVGYLLKEMLEEYQDRKLGSTEIYRCKLTEILIYTLRLLVQTPQDFRPSSMINEIIHYVNKRYKTPLSLQDICREKHYHLSYISRRFRQETGITFRDYVQKVRIEKSCELLSGSDMTVTEVANAVGYEDTQFFQTIFKKLLKMTPREYRKLRK